MIVKLFNFFTFLFTTCIHLKYMLKNKIIINKKNKIKKDLLTVIKNKCKKYDDKYFVDDIDENDQ